MIKRDYFPGNMALCNYCSGVFLRDDKNSNVLPRPLVYCVSSFRSTVVSRISVRVAVLLSPPAPSRQEDRRECCQGVGPYKSPY